MQFILRWIVNTTGLWLYVVSFGTGKGVQPDSLMVFIAAGLIFSIVNSLLKPLIIFLSLPALLLTLGLFMIVVNGILVYIAILIAPYIQMTFLNAILAGLLLSLLNYIVSNISSSEKA